MSSDSDTLTELFASASLGAPRNAVGFVLWRVMHRYQREIDRALIGLSLTHLQFTTLTLVAWSGRSGAPATQSELARLGDIHPMQISHMLNALEAKGLVARRRSATNALAKNVEVTSTGVSTLRQALPLAVEVQRRLFGDQGLPGGSLLTTLLQIEEGD